MLAVENKFGNTFTILISEKAFEKFIWWRLSHGTRRSSKGLKLSVFLLQEDAGTKQKRLEFQVDVEIVKTEPSIAGPFSIYKQSSEG